jgi:hypothetical protein
VDRTAELLEASGAGRSALREGGERDRRPL